MRKNSKKEGRLMGEPGEQLILTAGEVKRYWEMGELIWLPLLVGKSLKCYYDIASTQT